MRSIIANVVMSRLLEKTRSGEYKCRRGTACRCRRRCMGGAGIQRRSGRATAAPEQEASADDENEGNREPEADCGVPEGEQANIAACEEQECGKEQQPEFSLEQMLLQEDEQYQAPTLKERMVAFVQRLRGKLTSGWHEPDQVEGDASQEQEQAVESDQPAQDLSSGTGGARAGFRACGCQCGGDPDGTCACHAGACGNGRAGQSILDGRGCAQTDQLCRDKMQIAVEHSGTF